MKITDEENIDPVLRMKQEHHRIAWADVELGRNKSDSSVVFDGFQDLIRRPSTEIRRPIPAPYDTFCDQCNQRGGGHVVLGDFGHSFCVCKECLIKALALLEESK